MGALSPLSSWMAEDDVLLKNSVEAGASLESLAKGAVRFSRRFTVRELQERWHSLLYDPIVSAEAAFHMIQFEQSALSKSNKAGNPKENKGSSGKRKDATVRSCYYALRKRIRNEPFNSMDLSFHVAPSNGNYIGNEDESLSGCCMLGSSVSDHLGLQESDLGIMCHAFPQIGNDGADDAFHTQFEGTIQEDFLMEPDIVHREIPYLHGENQYQNQPANELGQQKELAVTGDPAAGCPSFHGEQVFFSPIPECSSSFHDSEYSSAVTEMPTWRRAEGVSQPGAPVGLSRRSKDLLAGDVFSLPGNGNTEKAYDSVHTDSNLKLDITSEELKDATSSAEGYLAGLCSSLLGCTNDDLIYMDVDGKDVIDKSYYDGLLSSPNDANQDHLSNETEQEPSVAPVHLTIQSNGSTKLDNDKGSCHSVDATSEVQFLSSAAPFDPQHPELSNGVICCALNTEDPEIPCNEDAIFTSQFCRKSDSSPARRNFQDAHRQKCSSIKEFPSTQKACDGDIIPMHRDPENPGISHTFSQMVKSQVLPKVSLTHAVGYQVVNSGVKFDFTGSAATHKIAGDTYGSPTKINSTSNMKTLVPAELKEHKTTALTKQLQHTSADALTEKLPIGFDGFKCFPYASASCFKSEFDASARIQNFQVSSADNGLLDFTASEQLGVSISNPEDPLIDSDDDVPDFSDIEAMILDMDLVSEDQDLCSSEEVSRYQNEDKKRAIIRLEQCAHSYMQRAIASHGAFAILYGRHSKHYIKRPEVLIGRATEDVVVDIDLGREGRSNKISRRQALLNLDKSGSFHLKNLGKISISVNDKEIAPGQTLNIISSCLIEIRGMPFIFEANQSCVKHYLDSTAQNHQSQGQQV